MPASTARLPAVFFGHGTPWNTLADNRFTAAWHAFGARIRPRAILMISAHWYVGATRITAAARPRMVYDFSGTRSPLRAFRYAAPGDPVLAARVQAMLAPLPVELDERWGYDHGAWSVLAHAYPDADVPVVELSLDRTRPPAFHYDLARRLAPLREDGVLIAGSGNIIHNIEVARSGWDGAPAGWEARFERAVRERVLAAEHADLIDYERLPDALLAIPTPDHYLPMLSVLGTRHPGDAAELIVEGEDGDGLGMLSFVLQ